MEKHSKIFVCGNRGMVGSALIRALNRNGYTNIVTKSSTELDLTKQEEVNCFFAAEKPEYVFLAAAKVGGIKKNIDFPVEMLLTNLEIQNNVIKNSHLYHVKKLMFFGSSCIYPRLCAQPMKEDYFLTGAFEPTNEGYALAKAAGLRLCEYYNRQYGTNYISVMPCNLYGINDHYGENAHVLASLIHRFYCAKRDHASVVTVWGTGNQRREFLFTEDMAEAAVYLMEHYDKKTFINLGSGTDISIRELAELISNLLGYKGKIEFDLSKPDGMPQKLMDCTRLFDMGWKPKISLEDGIKLTIEDYIKRNET